MNKDDITTAVINNTVGTGFAAFLRFRYSAVDCKDSEMSLCVPSGMPDHTLTHALQVTRAVKKELYAMKQLNHDNVSRFVGACIEPGHVCIVTPYCSRGSLRVLLSLF